MSSIITLDYQQNIGDGVETINSNFKEISQYIQTVNTYISSSFVLEDFINNEFQTLKEIANIVTENSYNWNESYTLVAANSARWLQPLVFLYPCIFSDNTGKLTTAIKDEVIDWMNNQFPVTSITGEINYIENQKAYIGITYQTTGNNSYINHIKTLILSVEGCRWVFFKINSGSNSAPKPTPIVKGKISSGYADSEIINIPNPTPTPTKLNIDNITLTTYNNNVSIVGETNTSAKNNIYINIQYMKDCSFAIIGAGTSYNNCKAGANTSSTAFNIDGLQSNSRVGGNLNLIGHIFHLFINRDNILYYYYPTEEECRELYSILSQTPPILTSTGAVDIRDSVGKIKARDVLSSDLNIKLKSLTDINKYKIIQTATISCESSSVKYGDCNGGMSGYIAEILFLGSGSFTPKPTPSPSLRPLSFSMTLLELRADTYNSLSSEHTGGFQAVFKYIIDSYFFISLKHKTLKDQKYSLYADNNIRVGVSNLHYGLYDVEIICFNPNYPIVKNKIVAELYIPQISGLPYFKISGSNVNINDIVNS